MNMRNQRPVRSRRKAAYSRALLIAAVAVLFAGLFIQITMLSRISAQSKQASRLEKEIVELSANADNLELSINQYHNLENIALRARQLGMEQPNETQIRVVSVAHENAENTSTQTVEATHVFDGQRVMN